MVIRCELFDISYQGAYEFANEYSAFSGSPYRYLSCAGSGKSQDMVLVGSRPRSLL